MPIVIYLIPGIFNSFCKNEFASNIKSLFVNLEKSNVLNSLKTGHSVATITASLPIITLSITDSSVIKFFKLLGKFVIDGSKAVIFAPLSCNKLQISIAVDLLKVFVPGL